VKKLKRLTKKERWKAIAKDILNIKLTDREKARFEEIRFAEKQSKKVRFVLGVPFD